MKPSVLLPRLCVLPLMLALGACATNRSTISLDVPSRGVAADSGKVAVIESVSDERRFEEDPDEPSTPSLKKGDKYALDAEGRKAAIGRKRNGYGMAIGDITLQPPQTIETITRDLVADGLRSRGYRVVPPGGDVPADAVRVKVRVQEFWAWLTPGFWAIDMEARLKTLLQFGQGDRTIEVAAYGKKTAPTGREDNWKQAYDRVFQDYLDKQQGALEQSGL
jgi:hypothetical protein